MKRKNQMIVILTGIKVVNLPIFSSSESLDQYQSVEKIKKVKAMQRSIYTRNTGL